MKKKKITHLLPAIVIILLTIAIPNRVKGVEEPEVFATYSWPLAQPLYKDPSIPSEELYETEYAKYIVPIVVAADEEFQQISYWVPWNVNGLNWKEAALNIVERADNYIFDKYGVNFRVVGWITWQSNDNTTYYIDRIHELANQLNWNPELKGKTILAGFTGQIMVDEYGKDIAGCAFNPELNATKVILMHSESYCWDDNIFHHEISHLFGADDCNSDDCVMSGKKTLVWFWSEDGWIFWVGDYVRIAYQTHHYCYDCEWQVFNGPYSIKPYANPMYGKTSVGHGCGLFGGLFPI
jgi:hypothetical protein